MPDSALTQSEANALINMAKRRVDDREWDYPGLGGTVSIPLASGDGREAFFLDLRRGRIDLARGTHQVRGRQTLVLVRLDFGGGPHRNPDGEEVGPAHLHLYREGYGDKWAIPVPQDLSKYLADTWQTLEDFMRYCNIVVPPLIRRGLVR
jgi:hypothetical protein